MEASLAPSSQLLFLILRGSHGLNPCETSPTHHMRDTRLLFFFSSNVATILSHLASGIHYCCQLVVVGSPPTRPPRVPHWNKALPFPKHTTPSCHNSHRVYNDVLLNFHRDFLQKPLFNFFFPFPGTHRQIEAWYFEVWSTGFLYQYPIEVLFGRRVLRYTKVSSVRYSLDSLGAGRKGACRLDQPPWKHLCLPEFEDPCSACHSWVSLHISDRCMATLLVPSLCSTCHRSLLSLHTFLCPR